MLSDASGGDGSTGTITINILSALPEGEPQGSFIIRVSPMATGQNLLRLLCKEARVPLRPNYVLHTSEGARVPMDRKLMHITGIQEGKNLHWDTSENTQYAGGKCWNSFWFMALLCLLIGCVGLVAISIIYTHSPDNTQILSKTYSFLMFQYGIVFDAGSSHTAMFIYKWEGSKINLTAVATQDGPMCKADGGGISSYSNDAAAAGKSLVKCLERAKGQIPTNLQSSTPVYLGATAGMRLLREKNASASEAVLKSVRSTILSYPFQFSAPEQQALILSGSEEGSFSWITSNYITGSFHVHPPTDDIVPHLYVHSMGALDLGGASTQITFFVNNTKSMPKDFTFGMDLYGTNYSVYTHSYLCYGINQAILRFQAALIQAANFSTSVSNPCAPKGSIVNVTHNAIQSSACVRGWEAEHIFGHSIEAPDETDPDKVYQLHGESNATACRAHVAHTLFNFSAICPYQNCSFNGIFQPAVHGDFYAFSTYFYVMDFLNLTASEFIGYSNFTKTTASFCAKSWSEVKTMKTHERKNLPWYCFQSIFIDTLLVDGYKFEPNTTWKGIHFVQSVSGIDAGWTLGFILNESIKFPDTTSKKDLNTVTFSLLCILFSAFVLLSCFFVPWARRQQRRSRTFSFQANTYGAI